MRLDDWFLTPEERGNPATAVDDRPDGPCSWTENNAVEPLVDGFAYFERLDEEMRALAPGDSLYFADWEGDADERLAGQGTEVGRVLADLDRRGVEVRGLLWRSHPRQAHFSEQDSLGLTRTVDEAGGEILLDERVRRSGSHHQKIVILNHRDRADADVAYVGGIDLSHGRRDSPEHAGDEQVVDIAERYGPRPPWHDVQLEVRGPAVGDVVDAFAERWNDPTPLDHRNPWRMVLRRISHQPRRPSAIVEDSGRRPAVGTHAVQVLRTYPAKRPPYPFAPHGERSIARAYLKALRRARRLVYLEDQYFWSVDAAHALADALRREPELRVLAVVPRYPDQDGKVSEAASRFGRERAIGIVRRAGGDRVAVYDLENRDGTPIYVHAKVCVIDDVWMIVGSDNLNRRSWTHDSEISCAVIDTVPDEREPLDPGGLGDGARRLARDTRLRLWGEHLGRADDELDDLVDPSDGFAAFARSADELEAWHEAGRQAARPQGHARPHAPEQVGRWAKWWAHLAHRFLLDPDGRPRGLRHRGL